MSLHFYNFILKQHTLLFHAPATVISMRDSAECKELVLNGFYMFGNSRNLS